MKRPRLDLKQFLHFWCNPEQYAAMTISRWGMSYPQIGSSWSRPALRNPFAARYCRIWAAAIADHSSGGIPTSRQRHLGHGAEHEMVCASMSLEFGPSLLCRCLSYPQSCWLRTGAQSSSRSCFSESGRCSAQRAFRACRRRFGPCCDRHRIGNGPALSVNVEGSRGSHRAWMKSVSRDGAKCLRDSQQSRRSSVRLAFPPWRRAPG